MFEINIKVVKACVYDTLHKLYVVVVGCQSVLYLKIGQGCSPEQRGIWTFATEQWDLLLRDGKFYSVILCVNSNQFILRSLKFEN